jgi:hypothetical protein
MTPLKSIEPIGNHGDNRPLPLIVAEKWSFPLAHRETEQGLYFAVQDWLRGISSVDNVRLIWAKMKDQLLISIQQLPYISTDGKTYQLDFTNDKGLYLIAQYMRSTKARPSLAEIKRFLASAGAFADLVRREPEAVITSGAIDPDAAIDAAIEAYRKMGKDDRWISARIDGKIKRAKFTAALRAAVNMTLAQNHYAIATDDIYVGLWGRTAAILRGELEITTPSSLRDYQPALALVYQGLAEEVSARKLGDRQVVTWKQARDIIKEVAELIGIQAKATGDFLQIDIATGKALLNG